jgi:hypothetical protein
MFSYSLHRLLQDQDKIIDLDQDLDQDQDLVDLDQDPDLDIGTAVFRIRFIDCSTT